MASIRKRGSTYQITVSNGYDINGKKITETATFTPDQARTDKQNQKALDRFVFEFEERVKSGKYLSGEKLTYQNYIELWKKEYAEKQLEVTSRERAYTALEKNILPEIGHIVLAKIMPLHLQSLYSKLSEEGFTLNGKKKKYSTNTIKRIHSVISGTLNTAVQWGLIDSNPCNRAKPPKVTRNPSDIKHFTLDEAKVFLSLLDQEYTVIYRGRKKKDGTASAEHVETRTVPTQMKVFFNIALFGGLRRGELIALKWSDINFDNNSLSVSRSTAKTKAGKLAKLPKSNSSIRAVYLPPAVIKMLKHHRKEQREYQLSLGSYWKGDDYLFTQQDGSQMDVDTPNHIFKKIINRYNETADVKLPDISIHGLRHTAATLMIAQNIDVRTVAGRLGHSETSTTLDIYAHSLKEMDEKAGDILESILIEKKPKNF